MWQYYLNNVHFKYNSVTIYWLFHGYKSYFLNNLILNWLWLIAHAWIHNQWCAHKPRHSFICSFIMSTGSLPAHLFRRSLHLTDTTKHKHLFVFWGKCNSVRRHMTVLLSPGNCIVHVLYLIIELERFNSIFMSPKEFLENHWDKVNTFNENLATSEQ